MSVATGVGSERNLLDETPDHAHQLAMQTPILRSPELEKLRQVDSGDLPRPHAGHHVAGGRGPRAAWRAALERVCAEADEALADGINVLVLSDRGLGSRARRRSRRCWPSAPSTTTSCARARACRPASCSSPASRARCTTSRR